MKRLLKRLGVGILTTFVVIVLIVYVGRASLRMSGSRHLDAITAKLDNEEPGWRLSEIEAARRQAAPPPDRNPSKAVLDLQARIPAGWEAHRQKSEWSWEPVRNRLPGEKQKAWLSAGEAETADHRAAIRAVLLRPEYLSQKTGYFHLHIPENPYATLLPHANEVRSLVDLLVLDSRLALLDDRPDRAIQSARAQVVLARSIGDEPFLISQLVRMACLRASATTVLQTIAWSEPREGFAELQAAFREESDFPGLLHGLRGERAMVDRIFDGLESGKITLRDLESAVPHEPRFLDDTAIHLYQGLLPADRAKALETFTQYIAAAKLPHHERAAAFAAVPLPPGPPDSFRYIVSRLILPASEKVSAAETRIRADLLTASAAIACERFRQARGRWPDRLDEIPRDILSEVPIDPFNGEPVQYRRMEDGIAVYTIGDDDRSALERRRNAGDPLVDLGRGWRLWDPPLRGLPAEVERNRENPPP